MLTRSAIRDLYNGIPVQNPLVQVTFVATKPSANGVTASLILSDGEHSFRAVGKAQVAEYFIGNAMNPPQIPLYSVVRLLGTALSELPHHRILIVLSLQMMSRQEGIIGNPVDIATFEHQQQVQQAVQQHPPQPVSTPFVQTADSSLARDNRVVPLMTTPIQPTPYGTAAPDGTPLVPISALSPFNNRWTFKARVAFKGDIKTWDNAKGTGHLFNMDLVDASGQIRCTAFHDAVDHFYPLIEEGKVYYFSRGTIKPVRNFQYSTSGHQFEMSLSMHSIVNPTDDESGMPVIQIHPRPLNEIPSLGPDELLDVVAIVYEVGELDHVTKKADGTLIPLRRLKLCDDTGCAIELKLWGRQAENFALPQNGDRVIVAMNCRISDFGGRSLNAISKTSIKLNVDTPEGNRLRGWWAHQDHSNLQLHELTLERRPTGFGNTPFMTLQEGINMSLGTGEQAQYFASRVFVKKIRYEDNATLYYTACPKPGCSKKVTQDGPDKWYCSKCSQSYDGFLPRYIFSFVVSDMSTSQWVNGFNDEGVTLLGVDANVVKQLRDENNNFELGRLFEDAMYKRYNMKFKVTEEFFQDQKKMRFHAQSIQPLDYIAESQKLIDLIQATQ